MSDLYTIIMAGGRGERLWPRSNNHLPKQFSKIVSDKTMLEETIHRCKPFSSSQKTYISTLHTNLPLIKKIIPYFSTTNIIVEPMIRDTACAILLATLITPAQNDDVLVFVPADHYLKEASKFKSNILHAFRNTQKNGRVTLIGITPTYPSTEYGYLKTVAPPPSPNQKKTNKILSVEKFVEKPDLRKARRYLKSGNYLWNSGIFMFNRGYLLSLFKEHTPHLYTSITQYIKLLKARKTTQAHEVFKRIAKVSFDYAIAEKITSIACVRSTFFWDDVGSWESIFRIKDTDKNGNIIIPENKCLVKDSVDNLCLIDDDQLVVLNGVKELIVIASDNKIYISHRKSTGHIKSILRELETKKKKNIR